LAEIEELKSLQAGRTPEMVKAFEYWNDGAVVRWNEIARDLVARHKTDPPMASRIYALLSVAQYDALIAAEESRREYMRIPPYMMDGSINPLNRSPDPTYPSDDAAVASASSAFLQYAYPDEAEFLENRSAEHRESCLWAGTNYRSDIDAGDEIGRAAAEKVIERAREDGSNATWNGTLPTGPGYWNGTNPVRPEWGNVRTWIVSDVAKNRPDPPPAFGSSEFEEALSEVRRISDTRTEEQLRIALFWADGTGTYTPPGHWNDIASALINEHDMSEIEAAHILALTNMAMMDAGVCCWDCKYHYCLIRPWQADPSITTPVGKPNFPAYTSGHSAFSASASEVLGYFFPDKKDELETMAEDAGISRLYGGIHYRFDIEEGKKVGREIGLKAIDEDSTRGRSSTRR
jgi:membrane-associated phospholipid phosphatase